MYTLNYPIFGKGKQKKSRRIKKDEIYQGSTCVHICSFQDGIFRVPMFLGCRAWGLEILFKVQRFHLGAKLFWVTFIARP
jgi:hypothetical protein